MTEWPLDPLEIPPFLDRRNDKPVKLPSRKEIKHAWVMPSAKRVAAMKKANAKQTRATNRAEAADMKLAPSDDVVDQAAATQEKKS